jgi:hypothetical protein
MGLMFRVGTPQVIAVFRKSSFVRVGIFEVLYGAEGILLK